MSSLTKEQRTRGADYEAPVPVPKAKRTRGRPSEYDEAYLPEAVEMVRHGATDAEIAEQFGIGVPTLYRWFNTYPELRKAVRDAKDIADDRVERSLYHQAQSGNTTAQIFWLKNRRRADWQDRRETEIVVPLNDDQPEMPMRELALAGLALLSAATYDADDEPAPVIEAHATRREETDDEGFQRDAERSRRPGEATRGAGAQDIDFDPGEL